MDVGISSTRISGHINPLSLVRESQKTERITPQWGCDLLSSRTNAGEGHVCSHHQFKTLGILI